MQTIQQNPLPFSEDGTNERKREEEVLLEAENAGIACMDIGMAKALNRQHQDALKWLTAGMGLGEERCKVCLATLLHRTGEEQGLQYKVDEALFLLESVQDENLKFSVSKAVNLSSHFSHRFLVHSILLGSLKVNRNQSIHKSFFSSSILETQLIPVIAGYLIDTHGGDQTFGVSGGRKQHETTVQKKESYEWESVCTVWTFCLLTLKDTSNMRELELDQHLTLSLFSLLPLLPQSTTLRSLSVTGYEYPSPQPPAAPVDLSTLSAWDTSKIEMLQFGNCQISSLSALQNCDLSSLQQLSMYGMQLTSLSPLALCCLPSLTTLQLGRRRETTLRGLTSLDGLTKQCTAALSELSIDCEDLQDISALTLCSLSLLESLSFSRCSVLSNFSPLSSCNLSILECLEFVDCPALSSLSFFVNCEMPCLAYLELCGTGVDDLSPLSLCSLPELSFLSITSSPLSSLSPLSTCHFPSLETFQIMNCDVSDVSFFSQWADRSAGLSSINLSNTMVEDISPISQLTISVRCSLNLSDTLVVDIAPLSKLIEGGLQVRLSKRKISVGH